MNMIYSDICQKILGEYSEKNKYHSQLLYLLCYVGNVRKVTDIDKIVNLLKRLKKEESFEDDMLYKQFCAVNEESHTKSEYVEDFNIRCELYYYSINFDEQSMDINCHLGYKKHKKMLKDLYKICLMYCIVIREMDEDSKSMEKQIRENIFSCMRFLCQRKGII